MSNQPSVHGQDWNLATSLRDKSVIVTGAAGGIGRAVVEGLADVGARLVAVDTDAAAVGSLVESLDEPDRHDALTADLADLSTHDNIVSRCVEHHGQVDALVHLAAVLQRRDTLDDVTEADWDFQLDTNLKATFFLNRTVAQQMAKQASGGKIVNFTSQAWWSGGYGGSVVYAASKGGVVSMSRGLARSLADDGITVNTIAPGAVDTPMMRSGLTDEELAAHVEPIPLGRMAEPREMVGAVLFLISDLAEYITGATINTTGGWLMY